MKKYINLFVLVQLCLSTVFLVQSCKLKTVSPDGKNVGYDYFPLEVGRYVIYEERDQEFNATTTLTDTIYEAKELIATSFPEGNEQKYVLYRFLKTRSDTEWPDQPDSVWTIVNTSNQLVRTRNNVSYIKLVFPVTEGKTWDGHARNTFGSHTYRMKNVDRPYQTYPETLRMEINNSVDPIIGTDIRYEIYARGVGMIYQDYYVFDKQADYGTHRVMKVLSYGHE